MTQTQKLAATQVVEIAEAHAGLDWVDDYLGSIRSVCDAVIDALRSQPVSQQLTGSLELDYQRLMEKHNALHLNALSYRAANSILAAEVERLNAQAVNAPEWLPIESAPDDMTECVVVRWVNSEGEECRELDYKDGGCWMGWHEHAEHAEIIGGHGVSYTPPYEHYMSVPPAPPAQQGEQL